MRSFRVVFYFQPDADPLPFFTRAEEKAPAGKKVAMAVPMSKGGRAPEEEDEVARKCRSRLHLDLKPKPKQHKRVLGVVLRTGAPELW